MKMTNLIFCALLYFAMPDVAKAQTTVGQMPSISVDSCLGSDVFLFEHGTGANADDYKLTLNQLVDSLLPAFDGSKPVDFTGGVSVSSALTVGAFFIDNDTATFNGPVTGADTFSLLHLRLTALAAHSATLDSAVAVIDSNGNVNTGCYFSCTDTNSNLASRHYVDSIITGNSSGWSLTGNAGTTAGTNFIGTTDAIDVEFKISNFFAGIIDSNNATVALGLGTDGVLNSGSSVAFGYRCLKYAHSAGFTAPSGNTAIGSYALTYGTTLSKCTGIGEQSFWQNTTGGQNTGLGYLSGQSNITGNQITILGANADVVTDGLTNSTSIGSNALIGSSNTISLGDSTANGNVGTFVSIGSAYSHSMLTIQNGNVQITNSSAPGTNGLILQDSAGACWIYKPTTGTGVLAASSITCP